MRYSGCESNWQDRALCRGPQSGIFYAPFQGERRNERHNREAAAKAICAKCIVKQECLEYAIRIKEQHGIWGGTNETERKKILIAIS